ncbi:hypothetical protein PR202_ga24640 [Eleusine coracana subsp. coracana]|uniref:DUF1618 domain-containing protein n=1 Tax=Eleusine coracana subsp. coracana TaxID=191504 RepID=A0AAV5D9G9_ELECO|nr:hypothetical protein PR202_ga24640 [Eleusine coracana subsp. coracana]
MFEPEILCSDNNIAVVRVTYNSGARHIESVRDLAVADCDYRAHSDDELPSLEAMPNPKPLLFHPEETALFPCTGGDGDDFVMTILRPAYGRLRYDLHIFSSRTNTWMKRLALQDPPSPDTDYIGHETDKVISLGGGTFGWVDLWHGVLLCNVLDDDAPGRRPEADRDHANNTSKRPQMVDSSWLLEPCVGKNATEGWTAVTWKMKLSGSQWMPEHRTIFRRSSIVHQLGHDHSDSSALRNLVVAGPLSSMDGGDSVYLMAKADSEDKNAWAIALNIWQRMMLRLFVEQYENALRDKVEKEDIADFHSFKSTVPCVTHYDIEKQF